MDTDGDSDGSCESGEFRRGGGGGGRRGRGGGDDAADLMAQTLEVRDNSLQLRHKNMLSSKRVRRRRHVQHPTSAFVRNFHRRISGLAKGIHVYICSVPESVIVQGQVCSTSHDRDRYRVRSYRTINVMIHRVQP